MSYIFFSFTVIFFKTVSYDFTEVFLSQKGKEKMSLIIQSKNRTPDVKRQSLESISCEVKRIIPKNILWELEDISRSGRRIEEIRLRYPYASSVTSGRENIFLKSRVGKDELERMFFEACGGSPYAYSETVKKGYITLGGGVRLGICGKASVEGERIIGVREISGINIRIPSYIGNIGKSVAELFVDMHKTGKGGGLIFSPPGEGKTTLLKNIAVRLASGAEAMRVVIVDSRDELSALPAGGDDRCIDILSGYPKAEGIEIATRTMNAELIVCDEIGNGDEVEAILSAQNCGVPLLASAHAFEIEGLLRRKGIKRLHEERAFDMYIGIRRPMEGLEYDYSFITWEAANDRI